MILGLGFQALTGGVISTSRCICGGEWQTEAQVLTYMLDDPADRGLEELVHGLARHPEHPL